MVSLSGSAGYTDGRLVWLPDRNLEADRTFPER